MPPAPMGAGVNRPPRRGAAYLRRAGRRPPANRARAAGVKSIGTKELGFNCNLLGDDPGHLGLGVPLSARAFFLCNRTRQCMF